MEGEDGVGSNSSPPITLFSTRRNVSGPLPVLVTRKTSSCCVAPAVTAALGVCAVTMTSMISATVTLTVLEVAVVETVPTLYETSAVLLMVVPAATPTACAGLSNESERQCGGDAERCISLGRHVQNSS